jgi:hypothetical protein
MAQHDMNIANQGFPAFRSDLNNALSAIQTNHSGTSRPTGAVAGQIWLDTTNATSPTLKFYDGTDDISLATIDYSANTVNWLDSTVSADLIGDTSPQLGGMLDVNGNAIGDGVLELLKFIETASAVNELTITNSATANAPELSSTGDDTNIDIKITPKGSGNVVLDGLKYPNADGTVDQVLKTDGSGNLSFTDVSGGISWQSVQTTGFTAVKGNAYPCNTTSAAFTVTLPATPSAGDQVQLVDYAGTFDTNALTIDPNGEDIEGGASNLQLTGEREGVILTYIDSTQGWIATSGINEGTDALSPLPIDIDYLVVAGGGAGGNYGASGGGGAGGLRTSYGATSGGGASNETAYTSVSAGTVITVTVGAGGANQSAGNDPTQSSTGLSGSNSSISGSSLTTITSIGGGGGARVGTGGTGGSGGGGGDEDASAPDGVAGGSGTANQGYDGGDGGTGPLGDSIQCGGGGGGASASGSNGVTSSQGGAGGNGLAVSITGSSVSYAGGGGGSTGVSIAALGGSGGTGGGGTGGSNGVHATNGTANTGGGGGGETNITSYQAGSGGSGVVILRLLASQYTGTTTGSPTVTDDGDYKVVKFTGSGSYTT